MKSKLNLLLAKQGRAVGVRQNISEQRNKELSKKLIDLVTKEIKIKYFCLSRYFTTLTCRQLCSVACNSAINIPHPKASHVPSGHLSFG